MPERHVPVHPDLQQLRHQAKDLRALKPGGEQARHVAYNQALTAIERDHTQQESTERHSVDAISTHLGNSVS